MHRTFLQRLSPCAKRLVPLILAASAAMFLFCSSAALASPVLVRTINGWANPPTSSGQISFKQVGTPGSPHLVSSNLNPIFTGNNIYAPDYIRLGAEGSPSWHAYYGGWQSPSDFPNDQIYLRTSSGVDPADGWSPVQTVVDNGQYDHVNDPSVVLDDSGTWHMVYTTFDSGGDWINYSTSTDGIDWTPSAGQASTEITMSDPFSKALGTVDQIARPALVKTESGWRMWFDARTNVGFATERIDSYLAESTAATPTDFRIIKRYTALPGFPGFMEPDVAQRDDGTWLAVVQRHFNELWLATSSNGIDFTFSNAAVLDADHPLFGRDKISNPGLFLDQQSDIFYGVGFGMTNSPQLTGHDTGFAYGQPIIQARSPATQPGGDPVWHVFAASGRLDEQHLSVFNFSDFDLVRILDPSTGATILEHDFTSAHPGDVWELRPSAELAADFDGDDDTDGDDFLVWQRQAGLTTVATIHDGDANGNGNVGPEDLTIWRSHFQTTPAAILTVPEPACSVLSFMAVCCLLLVSSGNRSTLGRRRGPRMKLSVTLVCFFLAGCGSSSPFELEQVEGNVAYSDGSRIEADQLLVKFVPQGVSIQGKDAPRAAETYADTGDGSFKNLTTWKYADGVMVGRHKVVVMSLRVNSHGVGEPTNAVPIRYQKASTTPLEVEVTSASKVFSFKIEKDS